MAKKRLEWRVQEKYSEGLPALLLVGPSAQFAEEVYVACSYRARDVDSMKNAMEHAVQATRAYRAQGWTVSEKLIDLPAMLAV